MLAADHPFKLPIDPAILSDLRNLFTDAAAKHPPITFTSITSIKPWPLIGVNVPELLDAMVQYMGLSGRSCIAAHDSPPESMGPPYEFFFAQRDALDCYRALARRVGEQTPLGPYKDWTYTLHQLALSPDVVSFRAPERRIHGYPRRWAGQGWLWAEEHQAPKFWHPVAVVCYWQLADLWDASTEAMDVWSKKRTGNAKGQMRAELTPALPPRLTVELAQLTLILDGQIYEVKSRLALRWVKVLADHAGDWISGPELEKHDLELMNVRTDRLKKHLPEAVLGLIDTQVAKGSRIRLA